MKLTAFLKLGTQRFALAHVLFLDIVGHSKLSVKAQVEEE